MMTWAILAGVAKENPTEGAGSWMALVFLVLLSCFFLPALVRPAAKDAEYRRRGTLVDDGRGPSSQRKSVTGTPVVFSFQGVEHHGLIFDDEVGTWVLGRLPLHREATMMNVGGGGSHSQWLRVHVETGDVAQEVIGMCSRRDLREGDVTLSVERVRGGTNTERCVMMDLWVDISPRPAINRLVLVGRLDYESILSLRDMKTADGARIVGVCTPVGTMVLTRVQ